MMLSQSVAAGAHAASVSSRKPLVVRSQAVAEVATNGSSTATAPPPRAKASLQGHAAIAATDNSLHNVTALRVFAMQTQSNWPHSQPATKISLAREVVFEAAV